jgi:hypothetical protein
MGEDKFHKSYLTPALDVCTFYPRVVAVGFLKCDKRELLELTEFVALEFRSVSFPDENAGNMLWQSVDIDENHFYYSTVNVFMLSVLSREENPQFLKETAVLLMASRVRSDPAFHETEEDHDHLVPSLYSEYL